MQTRQRLDSIHAHPDFPVAARVIERLAADGAVTLLAGGGVRDALLGRAPKDLDLATAAPPERVQALFSRTVDIGKAFGTIIVIEDGAQIEVTTFRREDAYLDGRRPSGVTFTDAREDAERRDFTVNALFYDPLGEAVIDYVDGRADLAAHRLRTVGDPRRRFAEDHLRILRAVRFVAQLEFQLDPPTAAAVAAHAGDLVSVAPERVLAEMKRLLESPHRALGLRAARATGVLDVVWPEFDPQFLTASFANWENAYAGLNWARGAAVADKRLAQWRAPNDVRRRVGEQMRGVETLLDADARPAARLRALGGPLKTEVRALARLLVPPQRLTADLASLASITTAGGELPVPYLNGEDLARLGVPRGARMGEILRKLGDAQLEGLVTSRDEAEARARLWLNE
jgi:tRNA nucleotidyltransferase (CCA-adding enzyme)